MFVIKLCVNISNKCFENHSFIAKAELVALFEIRMSSNLE